MTDAKGAVRVFAMTRRRRPGPSVAINFFGSETAMAPLDGSIEYVERVFPTTNLCH